LEYVNKSCTKEKREIAREGKLIGHSCKKEDAEKGEKYKGERESSLDFSTKKTG